MRWPRLVLLTAAAAALSARAAPAADASSEAAESLSGWQWFHEVRLPAAPATPQVDFLLTPSVFDQARTDLGDLRLYDAGGREVPFALRVRRERDERQALKQQTFNPQTTSGRTAELSVDLGENPVEYQEIDVLTAGRDFRRRVQLEGSADGKQWGALATGWLVNYLVDRQLIDIHRLTIAPTRFRYLHVEVTPDASQKGDSPHITSVAVYRRVRTPGEDVTQAAALGAREPVPTPDGPGTAWTIDLGGAAVPCQLLRLEIEEHDFVRPFVLEQVEEPNVHVDVAHGELRRPGGTRRGPVEIRCDQELQTRFLRLVVTDNRNPPLNISGVRYTAPAREVVFAPNGLAGPLRFYVGNPEAEAPRYDFEKNLPAVLVPAPVRVEIGPQTANPTYLPEPEPFTERWPWLPYAVLTTASLVLLGMLLSLARAAVRRHDEQGAVEPVGDLKTASNPGGEGDA
jgi:hypothetical protein